LAHCDTLNNTKENIKNRRAAANLAIELSSEKLESSKFFLAYENFGPMWVEKRGQAMRFVNVILKSVLENN
jgi:hypothetical protein